MIVSELLSYPIKGGKFRPHSSSLALGTGFPDDRRFLLVDKEGRFVTQRTHPSMARLELIPGERLRLNFDQASLEIPRAGLRNSTREVTVWNDRVPAYDLGDEAAAFVSRHFGEDMRFCEALPDGGTRQLSSEASEGERVDYFFADGAPYLVVSQESLDLLNEKLEAKGKAPVDMLRFRPNIVVKGWTPHAEDQKQTLGIGDKLRLKLYKPCSRCNVVEVEQQTGAVGDEPLATLAQYRKLGTSKIFFGMNAYVAQGAGQTIRVGDRVTLLDRA